MENDLTGIHIRIPRSLRDAVKGTFGGKTDMAKLVRALLEKHLADHKNGASPL